MYSAVDKSLTNTPHRVIQLRSGGNIQSLNTTDFTNSIHTFGKLQPLCGEFGMHLPEKTTMHNSQHKLAWATNIKARAMCTYQNQVYENNELLKSKQIDSTVSDGPGDNSNPVPLVDSFTDFDGNQTQNTFFTKGMLTPSEAAHTSRMPTAPYKTSDNIFHKQKKNEGFLSSFLPK